MYLFKSWDTYAIGVYHHWCCEFESQSGRGVQHYVIKFVSDLWQVSGFLRVLRLPLPLKISGDRHRLHRYPSFWINTFIPNIAKILPSVCGFLIFSYCHLNSYPAYKFTRKSCLRFILVTLRGIKELS
jgi:hypothetical protein